MHEPRQDQLDITKQVTTARRSAATSSSNTWGRFRQAGQQLITNQPRSAMVLALVVFGLYGAMAVMQWRQYYTTSYDLAIFTQLFDRYANFQVPIVNVKGPGYNLLGDHFHPLLALLTPFYMLAPSPLTVMFMQAGLLAVSTYFVAKIGHEHLGVSGGWLIGLAYGISWGVQTAAAVQFHEVALAAVLISISLWALLRQSWRTAAVWAGLLVFVKEDLGLTVALFGLILAWRSRNWLLGGLLTLWGAVWCVVTVKFIIPSFNPGTEYDHTNYFNLKGLFTNPMSVLVEILTNERKMMTLLLLLACSVGLILRSNLSLLILPTLAYRFLSTKYTLWGPSWHYSLILMSIVFAAVVDAICAMQRSSWQWPKRYARHAAATVAAVAVTLTLYFPLLVLLKRSYWTQGPVQQVAAQVVSAVPKGASVLTDYTLSHHFTPNPNVYITTNKNNPLVDYLVIDMRSGRKAKVDVVAYGKQRYPGTNWRVLIAAEGFQLAKRIS